MGTKVEIKNLNSIKAAADSVDYEIKRQSKALDVGEKIIQETRGWDENKKQTCRNRRCVGVYRVCRNYGVRAYNDTGGKGVIENEAQNN